MSRENVRARIDKIERSYEFFLAFAAQGVRNDRESQVGGQLRDFLSQAADALDGLADDFRAVVETGELEPREAADTMVEVLSRDAEAAEAAVRLVLGRDAIGSQLVDNLNATIHIRALLTDLFLIDEVLGK